MKFFAESLKVGDVFKIEASENIFKVIEVLNIPLCSSDFKKTYPIICDCFNPVKGINLGYLKLPDNIIYVDLLYRECEEEYKPLLSVIKGFLENSDILNNKADES